MSSKMIIFCCPKCGAKKPILSTQKEVTCGKCKTSYVKEVKVRWKKCEFHHAMPNGKLVSCQ